MLGAKTTPHHLTISEGSRQNANVRVCVCVFVCVCYVIARTKLKTELKTKLKRAEHKRHCETAKWSDRR